MGPTNNTLSYHRAARPTDATHESSSSAVVFLPSDVAPCPPVHRRPPPPPMAGGDLTTTPPPTNLPSPSIPPFLTSLVACPRRQPVPSRLDGASATGSAAQEPTATGFVRPSRHRFLAPAADPTQPASSTTPTGSAVVSPTPQHHRWSSDHGRSPTPKLQILTRTLRLPPSATARS
jgi:hypothetical protein